MKSRIRNFLYLLWCPILILIGIHQYSGMRTLGVPIGLSPFGVLAGVVGGAVMPLIFLTAVSALLAPQLLFDPGKEWGRLKVVRPRRFLLLSVVSLGLGCFVAETSLLRDEARFLSAVAGATTARQQPRAWPLANCQFAYTPTRGVWAID
jgi:hypothetical protein